MKYDFVVLGATGLQGRISSKDLLTNGHSVLLMGRDKKRVEHLLKRFHKSRFEYFEAQNIPDLARKLKKSGANVVVNCVEGDWNLHILKACLSAKVNCLDLDSNIPMTKKQFEMDPIFKKHNLISLTGCGSVPGTGNVMLRYAAEKFDSINTIEGGFAYTSNIKKFVVPFSILSVIEEFTYPAPIIQNGRIVIKKPMENIRKMYHRGIGVQDEFLVDHQETFTFYHYYKKKGLRNLRFYAGFPEEHFKPVKTFIDTGLGSKKQTIEMPRINKKFSPMSFLTQALKEVKVPEGYKETENLWIKIWGKKDGKPKKILMECIVPTLKGWEDAYANIDTGMPISIMAQMVKKGIIENKGVFSPEGCVPPQPYFKELRRRKMVVYENGKVIN